MIPFAIMTLLLACTQGTSRVDNSPIGKLTDSTKQETIEVDALLDSLRVVGSILIFDPVGNTYYSNDFERVDQGFLPASTFKIPNSIIGLETGVINNEEHIFNWDGSPRGMKIWEKDLNLKEAFAASCVPCYRNLARTIGFERMKSWTEQLGFGQMDVQQDNLDLFWLQGKSRITQREEIDFLVRFYQKELPISTRTHTIMKEVMIREKNEYFTWSGKTGMAVEGTQWTGWYVGYVERKEGPIFFATNIVPEESMEFKDFAKARLVFTETILKELLSKTFSR